MYYLLRTQYFYWKQHHQLYIEIQVLDSNLKINKRTIIIELLRSKKLIT